MRELFEETGYKEGVTVRRSSPVLVKDPGCVLQSVEGRNCDKCAKLTPA